MNSEGRAIRNPTGGRALFGPSGRALYQRAPYLRDAYLVSWTGSFHAEIDGSVGTFNFTTPIPVYRVDGNENPISFIGSDAMDGSWYRVVYLSHYLANDYWTVSFLLAYALFYSASMAFNRVAPVANPVGLYSFSEHSSTVEPNYTMDNVRVSLVP
jgi:hypothetical protein